MAQHTSRQRAHLLTCQAYLDAMKLAGIQNSITQRAANPSTFVKPTKADQSDGTEKRKVTQKITDFPIALRIQALALAEASISHDRVREITGIETKLLEKLRKTARERGYNPTTSMQIKDEYVADPVKQGQSRPKKQKFDGPLQNGGGQALAGRVIPGYVPTDTSSLPPGNWSFMSAAQVHPGTSLG
jgi:hypothetical protein